MGSGAADSEPIRPIRRHVDVRHRAGDHSGDDPSGHWPRDHARMSMSKRGPQVLVARRRADHRESVRHARAPTHPLSRAIEPQPGVRSRLLGGRCSDKGVRERPAHGLGSACRPPNYIITRREQHVATGVASGPFHAGVRESPSPPGRGVWGEGRVGIGLPVAKFLDISPSPPAPLPVGEGREPANPLPSQREMALGVASMLGDVDPRGARHGLGDYLEDSPGKLDSGESAPRPVPRDR